MARQGDSRIRDLFQPEEVAWRRPDRAVSGGRRGVLSLKAVFWCATAVAVSLALGNLM